MEKVVYILPPALEPFERDLPPTEYLKDTLPFSLTVSLGFYEWEHVWRSSIWFGRRKNPSAREGSERRLAAVSKVSSIIFVLDQA